MGHPSYAKRLSISILLGFTLGYSLLSGLLDAQWSVYADHEIAVYLGEDRRVLWNEIIPLVLKTEVGYPGETTRYRPSFYFLWVFESFLWGDCTTCWYAARIGLLTVYLAAIIFWLQGFTGWFCAYALTMLLCGMPGFTSIWIGIGNSEQYFSACGALYLLLGACALKHSHEMPRWSHTVCWLGILLSGLILIGLKENMLIMVLMPIFILTYRWWKNQPVDLGSILITATLVSYTLFIFISVCTAVFAHQADFYGTTITPGERIRSILTSLVEWPMILPTTLLVTLSAVMLLSLRATRNKRLLPIWARLALLYVGLLLHIGFYNRWVSDSRYSSPGELLLFAFLVLSISKLPEIIGIHVRWNQSKLLRLFCIGSCLVFYWKTLPHMKETLTPFVAQSHEYTRTLSQIRDYAEKDRSRVIVFKSAYPADFEAIFSVNRFLKYMKVQNPLVLQNLPVVEPYPNQEFFPRLRAVLEELAQSGEDVPIGAAGTLPSRYGAVFTPNNQIDSNTPCIAIMFQRAVDDGVCEKVFRVTY